jgi:hypothetical protein
MIDKITEICNQLPDIVKAVIFVSAISIFWSLVL